MVSEIETLLKIVVLSFRGFMLLLCFSGDYDFSENALILLLNGNPVHARFKPGSFNRFHVLSA